MKPFSILVIVLVFAGCRPTTENTTINVNGYAQIAVPPDLAEIDITVTSESNDRESAYLMVNRTVNSVIENLEASAVRTNSVNTGAFSLNFLRRDKTREIYYRGRQQIKVEIPLVPTEVEKLATIARKFSGTDFYIQYNVTTSKQDSVELLLGSMALKDAERKATYIAQSSGMELGPPITIGYHADALHDFRTGVVIEYFDEIGNSNHANLRLLPEPIELSDQIEVAYLAKKRK